QRVVARFFLPPDRCLEISELVPAVRLDRNELDHGLYGEQHHQLRQARSAPGWWRREEIFRQRCDARFRRPGGRPGRTGFCHLALPVSLPQKNVPPLVADQDFWAERAAAQRCKFELYPQPAGCGLAAPGTIAYHKRGIAPRRK